jgi:hypothetical protein
MSTVLLSSPQYDASENDLGISEYLNDAPGFSAVSKGRFSDFVVHEST